MADTWPTDLLDEEGGDQSMRCGFEAELRRRLAATWAGREVQATRAPGRLRWTMIAAALLAVAGVSAALLVRLNRTPSHVSLQPPAATDPAATTSIPQSSVPVAAVGLRWVVTSVAGVELDQSDLPWFRVGGDGAVDGYDGCNRYSVRPDVEGGVSTATACMPGVVPRTVSGPFRADSPTELRSGDVVAELFTSNGGARAPELIGEWQTPSGATTVRFAEKSLTLNGCANVRTWDLRESLTVSSGDENQLSACLTTEGQLADGRFAEQLAGGHADLSFRMDGSLWVATEQFVTRLVRQSATPLDSIEAKVVVNAETPVLTGTTIYSTAIANTHSWFGAVTPSGRVFFTQGIGSTAQEIIAGEAVPTDLVVDNYVYAGTDERLYVDDPSSTELRAYRETVPGGWVLDDSVPLAEGCVPVSQPDYFGCDKARLPITPPADASTVEFGSDRRVSVGHAGQSTHWHIVADLGAGEIPCLPNFCHYDYFRFGDDGVVWAPFVYIPSPDRSTNRQLAVVIRPDHDVASAWLDDTARVIGVHGLDVYAVSYAPLDDGSPGIALKRYRLPGT